MTLSQLQGDLYRNYINNLLNRSSCHLYVYICICIHVHVYIHEEETVTSSKWYVNIFSLFMYSFTPTRKWL